MNKKELIRDLRCVGIDQIVEAIQNGTVTLYELSKSGNLTPLTKMKIEARLSGVQNHVSNAGEDSPVDNSSKLAVEMALSNGISSESNEDVDESESQDVIIPKAVYNPNLDYSLISPSNETEVTDVSSNGVKKNGFFRKLFNKK